MWDRIISIEYCGYEHVYDIEVEGTHNFIGNNIFAHNTYTGEIRVAAKESIPTFGGKAGKAGKGKLVSRFISLIVLASLVGLYNLARPEVQSTFDQGQIEIIESGPMREGLEVAPIEKVAQEEMIKTIAKQYEVSEQALKQVQAIFIERYKIAKQKGEAAPGVLLPKEDLVRLSEFLQYGYVSIDDIRKHMDGTISTWVEVLNSPNTLLPTKEQEEVIKYADAIVQQFLKAMSEKYQIAIRQDSIINKVKFVVHLVGMKEVAHYLAAYQMIIVDMFNLKKEKAERLPDTLIHEEIHHFSSQAVVPSSTLSEGLTEYFTLRVWAHYKKLIEPGVVSPTDELRRLINEGQLLGLDWAKDSAYRFYREAAMILIDRLGEAKVLESFTGDGQALWSWFGKNLRFVMVGLDMWPANQAGYEEIFRNLIDARGQINSLSEKELSKFIQQISRKASRADVEGIKQLIKRVPNIDDQSGVKDQGALKQEQKGARDINESEFKLWSENLKTSQARAEAVNGLLEIIEQIIGDKSHLSENLPKLRQACRVLRESVAPTLRKHGEKQIYDQMLDKLYEIHSRIQIDRQEETSVSLELSFTILDLQTPPSDLKMPPQTEIFPETRHENVIIEGIPPFVNSVIPAIDTLKASLDKKVGNGEEYFKFHLDKLNSGEFKIKQAVSAFFLDADLINGAVRMGQENEIEITVRPGDLKSLIAQKIFHELDHLAQFHIRGRDWTVTEVWFSEDAWNEELSVREHALEILRELEPGSSQIAKSERELRYARKTSTYAEAQLKYLSDFIWDLPITQENIQKFEEMLFNLELNLKRLESSNDLKMNYLRWGKN